MMDGAEVDVRLGVGEDGLVRSLTTGMDGGSGRRLGVFMRTLRDGLDIRLDESREVEGGEDGRLEVLPEGVGDDVRLGGIDSAVDFTSSSSGRRSSLSLFRSGPSAASTTTCSCTSKAAAGEAKLGGDGCRVSSDPRSPLSAGPSLLFLIFSSSSVCAGAEEGAASLSLDARFNAVVGARVKNVTLRLSGLSVNIGRYCDCGLKPDVAFRLVFSRMVSMSCCGRRSANSCDTCHEKENKDGRDELGKGHAPLPFAGASQCA
jgi:hypothetical protein